MFKLILGVLLFYFKDYYFFQGSWTLVQFVRMDTTLTNVNFKPSNAEFKGKNPYESELFVLNMKVNMFFFIIFHMKVNMFFL